MNFKYHCRDLSIQIVRLEQELSAVRSRDLSTVGKLIGVESKGMTLPHAKSMPLYVQPKLTL